MTQQLQPRMSARRRAKKPAKVPVTTYVEKWDHQTRGIGRINGKTVFIEGAIPGETVSFTYQRKRSAFDEGQVCEVLEASPQRVVAKCEFFGTCGGCSLQHIDQQTQIQQKQVQMLEQMRHIANLQPAVTMPALQGEIWAYRHKARLGVRYVPKKGGVLVGFREKYSHYITDMNSCAILHPSIEALLLPLRTIIAQMQHPDKIPQLEVAVGDSGAALVIRHLLPLSEADKDLWCDFSQRYNIQIYLQSAGPESVYCLSEPKGTNRLYYHLPQFNLKLGFHPLDFTQVNHQMNRQMINQVIDLLAIDADDLILDLFCGLGNFSLALATLCKQVIGIEGSTAMVERAQENAGLNKLDNLVFHCFDLTKPFKAQPLIPSRFDKILIDPPRSGALEVVNNVAQLGAKKVLYISCNPATLARDAGVLSQSNYRLSKAGVLDMFPHTKHVESMALFEKVT